MKKILLTSSLATLTMLSIFISSTWAKSINEYISGDLYTTDWNDNEADYFIFTDTDGANDDSNYFEIYSDFYKELGDYTVGIYDWDGIDENTIVKLAVINTEDMEKSQIMSSVYAYTGSVTFDLSNDTVTSYYNSSIYDITNGIDETFGYYIQYIDSAGQTITYYSEAALNDGDDYFAAFYNSTGLGSLYNLAIGIEIGDTTALFEVSDVSPVPESATMLLFGTGLAGLAGVSRRKKS